MEGNRDDSDKCIRLAEDCLKRNEIEQALKYLNKAERLYPSTRAKELIKRISSRGSAASGADEADVGGAASGDAPSSSPGAEGTRHRFQPQTESAHDVHPKYTADQLEAVKKIRKSKDYYEILGVDKDCTEEDLKRAYKKLALKFHPDKNQAPGSTEAFKAIGNAFGVLSNADKRKRYDEFGSEESQPTSRRTDDFSRGFEGDISAEELFRMFFGGGFQGQSAQRFTYRSPNHRHTSHRSEPENNYAFLLQLSPLLIMVVLSLLSSLLIGEPLYSLQRDSKYQFERKTVRMQVAYYVKRDFRVGDKLDSMERQVEEDYVNSLRHNCYREKSYREDTMWRAKMYNSKQLYDQARNMKTPSCDRLQNVAA